MHDAIAEPLVDAIIEWVDARGLQVGGSPFAFALENVDGARVSRRSAEDLLQMIKRWAQARGVSLRGEIVAASAADDLTLFPLRAGGADR